MKSIHIKVKLIYPLIIIVSTLLSSCATLVNKGKQSSLSLVDAPDGITVTNKSTGQVLPVTSYLIYQKSYGGHQQGGGMSSIIRYYYPGIKFEPKDGTILELNDNGNVKTVEIKSKPMLGLLIGEGILTCGIFTIIDLISGSAKQHDPRFLDVDAIFTNKTPRLKKELKKRIYKNASPGG